MLPPPPKNNGMTTVSTLENDGVNSIADKMIRRARVGGDWPKCFACLTVVGMVVVLLVGSERQELR